jgi:hypothetical protein
VNNGISTNVSLADKAPCLAKAGIQFAIRYYSKPGSVKAMGRDEALALSKAKIGLGVVYQERARSPEEFTMAKARAHATNAWKSAKQIGQPAGTAIYFAVDYDASVLELRRIILKYFNELDVTLSHLAGGKNPYHLGVYGSGQSCKFLKENCGPVWYSWLSVSKGWAGSKSYSDWDLNQVWGKGTLCGLSPVCVLDSGDLQDGDYEYNECAGDFGSFFLD